jgi:hypothetical protein
MKYLFTFNELTDANLTLNDNPKPSKFDGGDGPSASEVPEPYYIYDSPVKTKRGNTAAKNQELRKKEYKERGLLFKFANYKNDTNSDDLSANEPLRKPTKNIGGATK